VLEDDESKETCLSGLRGSVPASILYSDSLERPE
jgi:hypothetical protein